MYLNVHMYSVYTQQFLKKLEGAGGLDACTSADVTCGIGDDGWVEGVGGELTSPPGNR